MDSSSQSQPCADANALAPNWPMTTAPRNGLSIIVGDEDTGEFVMHWSPTGTNSTFQPDALGIWEATDQSFTWSEVGGFGPTYWRPLPADGPFGGQDGQLRDGPK